jgi:hypothetical protein
LPEIGKLPPTVKSLHITGSHSPWFVERLEGLEALDLEGSLYPPPRLILPRIRSLTLGRFALPPVGLLVLPPPGYFHYSTLASLAFLSAVPEEIVAEIGRSNALGNLECVISTNVECLPVTVDPGSAVLNRSRLLRYYTCDHDLSHLPNVPSLATLKIEAEGDIDLDSASHALSEVRALSFKGLRSNVGKMPYLRHLKALDLTHIKLRDWSSLERLSSLREISIISADIPKLVACNT